MMNVLIYVALTIRPHAVQATALLEYLTLAVRFGHTIHITYHTVMTHHRAPSVLTKWKQTKKNAAQRIVFNVFFSKSRSLSQKPDWVHHWIINPFVYLDHGNTEYVYSVFCSYLNIFYRLSCDFKSKERCWQFLLSAILFNVLLVFFLSTLAEPQQRRKN